MCSVRAVLRVLALVLWFAGWGAPAPAADFLDPAVAFRPSAGLVGAGEAQAIELRFRIAPGYYMYRDQFRFAVDAPAVMGAPEFPPAKVKFDPNFNKEVATYREEVVVRVPVRDALAPVGFTVVSQGCADAGLCYAPQEARLAVSGGAAGGDDAGSLAATLKTGRLPAIVLLFFGLGLLMAFTPCVLPMVPILSSLIVGEQRGVAPARSRGLWLAAVYTLGMALVYTAMGIAAGLAGEGLAAWFQTPWFLALSAALLIGFALSMFDLYPLQMPQAVQSWLSHRFGRMRGGHAAGVFAMGALSALIVGPCMAAPLAGALVYISQTRDTVLGGTALFALALGMGAPLLLVGASAGALLPRVGPWMNGVKQFFGLLLIGVAIWLVSPVIPARAQLLAWAALCVTGAVLLGLAVRPGRAWAARALGVLALLAGAVLAWGAFHGAQDPLQALSAPRALAAPERAELVEGSAPPPRFERVASIAELDALLAVSDRPVMLDFYADWCVSCKEMERYTYTDARVAAELARLRLVQVDVTANTPEDRALLKRYQLFGPPGILFFGPGGRRLEGVTVIGYQDAQRFLNNLKRIASM